MTDRYPEVRNTAIRAPVERLREYDDGTVPLSYAFNLVGSYDNSMLEQPVFFVAGHGEVPYRGNTVLTSPAYCTLRDITVRWKQWESATYEAGTYYIEIYVGDLNQSVIAYHMVRHEFIAKPGQEINFKLPDIEHLYVPADMNVYVLVAANNSGSLAARQADFELNMWTVLDDK